MSTKLRSRNFLDIPLIREDRSPLIATSTILGGTLARTESIISLYIENGRVQDEPGRDFKQGLREIAKIHKGAFRLTANQHLLVSDVATEDLPVVKRLLAEYKLDNLEFSGLRLSSSACVAFPTCGLAMAESERVSIVADAVLVVTDVDNGSIFHC